MLRTRRWWKLTLVLLLWTVGLAAIWGVAQVALDPGIDDDAIRECVEEGFIPPDECEETLEDLEDEQVVVGLPLLTIVWFVGLLLLSLVWLGFRQQPGA
jgi:hypothetical protein